MQKPFYGTMAWRMRCESCSSTNDVAGASIAAAVEHRMKYERRGVVWRAWLTVKEWEKGADALKLMSKTPTPAFNPLRHRSFVSRSRVLPELL